MKKIIFTLLFVMCFYQLSVDAAGLTERQKENADVIAKIAIENYDTYGVLPSVAVVQAFIESTLGEFPSNQHNYFGICAGDVGYSSFYDGVIGYLKVINNGRYDGALFNSSYSESMLHILNGGYCYPVGDYYSKAIWSIEHYGFYEYDNELLEVQKQKIEEDEKKRKENEKKAKEDIVEQTKPKPIIVNYDQVVKNVLGSGKDINDICGRRPIMLRKLTDKEKNSLEKYRKEAIEIAEDFRYGTSVINNIKKARTEAEICNVMVDARRNKKW